MNDGEPRELQVVWNQDEDQSLVVQHGGRPLLEVRLCKGESGSHPLVTLHQPSLDLELNLRSFSVVADGARLKLGAEGVTVSSEGPLRLEGRERLELWGGQKRPSVEPDSENSGGAAQVGNEGDP